MGLPDWLRVLLQLAVGFTLLWKGAGWLVTGASRVARGVGISPLVVGLTVVAWGTSAPEVMVTLTAALRGTADLGLGNILGSNVANIGLVLGSCALVLPRILESRLAWRESGWLLASLAILAAVSWDWAITRTDSFLLLGAFLLHNVHLWRTSHATELGPEGKGRPVDYVVVVLGVAAIYFGCDFAVDGAVAGAQMLGVSELVVGLTVVAVGTSLPEFAAGQRSAFLGESEISLGNVVGSNVFNTLAVLGVVGLVAPIGDPAIAASGALPEPGSVEASFRTALIETFPVVALFSLALIGSTFVAAGRGGRVKGAILCAGWVGYTAYLYGAG